jgi:hypothetical protein
MKHTRLVTVSVLLWLVTLCSCSSLFTGTPSGSFPKQAGTFTLVDGPISQPKETPPEYGSEYKSSDGISVSHDVIPYPSADEAKKAFEEYKQLKGPESLMHNESVTESGNKLVFSKDIEEGMKTVTWVSNSWLCRTNSRDRNTAIQLAESLPYK